MKDPKLEQRLKAIETKLEEQMDRMEFAINELVLRGLQKKREVNPVDNIWKEIFDNFDWKKVRRCMIVTDWTWATVGGVPTVGELQKEAKKLVERAYENKIYAAFGGFEATFYEDVEGEGVDLRFILASWIDSIYNG